MSICDRCNNEKDLIPSIVLARPGGHTWSSSPESFRSPEPKKVCFDCLTDDEVAFPLNRVVAFVLTNLLSQVAKGEDSDVRNSALVSIQHTLMYFMVLNNNDNYRNSAIEALRGLLESERR